MTVDFASCTVEAAQERRGECAAYWRAATTAYLEARDAGQWSDGSEHAGEPKPQLLEVLVAFRLAGDLDTWRALLAGEPVDPARIDPVGFSWARDRRYVQMVRPIDLLLGAAA